MLRCDQGELAVHGHGQWHHPQALALGWQGHFWHQGHADTFANQAEGTAPLAHFHANITQRQPGISAQAARIGGAATSGQYKGLCQQFLQRHRGLRRTLGQRVLHRQHRQPIVPPQHRGIAPRMGG